MATNFNLTVVVVSQPQNVTVPHPDPLTCHRHALFLSSITNASTLFSLWLLFAVTSAILTGALVHIVDPSPLKPLQAAAPATTTSDVEATAIPAPPIEEQHNEEDLPPYEPSAAAVPLPAVIPATVATETPPVAVEPAVEAKPKPKRSSAYNFVSGTSLFLPTMLSYLLTILSMQSILYCTSFFFNPRGNHITVWIICFALPSVWVSMSILCWVILLLDLWGPGMRKKVKIPYIIVPFALLLAVMVPFALVFWIVFGVAKLCVKAVESCQRRFCEDALVEEREEDIELAAGQPRMETVNEVGEGSSAGVAEESIALMADTKTEELSDAQRFVRTFVAQSLKGGRKEPSDRT
jgi:hypothetical protein